MLFDPEVGVTSPSYIAAIDAAAPTLSVEVVKTPVHDAVDIAHALDAFAATAERRSPCTSGRQAGHARADCAVGAAAPNAGHLSNRTSTAAGGLMSYRRRYCRAVPARRDLRRPHPARRQGRRIAGAIPDQVQAGGQPKDRQGDRAHNPRDVPAARRRGDRISAPATSLAGNNSPATAGYLAPRRGWCCGIRPR